MKVQQTIFLRKSLVYHCSILWIVELRVRVKSLRLIPPSVMLKSGLELYSLVNFLSTLISFLESAYDPI